MRSKKLDHVRMPWRIFDAGQKRCAAEGYRSFARYMAGLVMLDIISGQTHVFAQPIANADPELQDQLLDFFLETPPLLIGQAIIQAVKSNPPNLNRKTP